MRCEVLWSCLNWLNSVYIFPRKSGSDFILFGLWIFKFYRAKVLSTHFFNIIMFSTFFCQKNKSWRRNFLTLFLPFHSSFYFLDEFFSFFGWIVLTSTFDIVQLLLWVIINVEYQKVIFGPKRVFSHSLVSKRTRPS